MEPDDESVEYCGYCDEPLKKPWRSQDMCESCLANFWCCVDQCSDCGLCQQGCCNCEKDECWDTCSAELEAYLGADEGWG